MAGGLFFLGLLISSAALWQLWRLLSVAQGRLKVSAFQIERLAEELLNTAEAASATVVEQTEALAKVVAEARSERERLQATREQVVEGAPAIEQPAAQAPSGTHSGPSGQAVLLATRSAAQREAPASLSKLLPPKEVPPLHRQVYALIDQGKPQAEVARQLKLSKGEIELILGMRDPGL